MDNEILVSVVVVSYNSSKTIIETLDSIRDQTYSPLELVISDDCSTDDTVSVCREWIEKNKSRFVRCEIIVVPQNTGIPGNCNRGISVAKGEWTKSIAGDDILLPTCIEDNMAYVHRNADAQIVFSRVQKFQIGKDGKCCLCGQLPDGEFLSGADNAVTQHLALLYKNPVPAVGCFFKTELLKKYPYKEYYKSLEDWPKWFELTGRGIRLYFLEKETVLYRVGGLSCATTNGTFYNVRLMESIRLFYLLELRDELIRFGLNKQKIRFDKALLRYDLLLGIFGNKKTLWSRFCRKIIRFSLSVFVR